MAVPPDGIGASRSKHFPSGFPRRLTRQEPEREGSDRETGGRCRTCRTRPLTEQFETTPGEATACDSARCGRDGNRAGLRVGLLAWARGQMATTPGGQPHRGLDRVTRGLLD